MPEETVAKNIEETHRDIAVDIQNQPNGHEPSNSADNHSPNKELTTEKVGGNIKSAEKWPIRISVATLLINTFIGLIYFGQLREMRKATDAATQASKTAAATLQEMKTGGGATDTHTLAQQAITQAAQMVVLAAATSKQADASKTIAENAVMQSKVASKSEQFLEAQLLPYISMLYMDLAEPITPNKLTKVTNRFMNEGGTVAFDVQNLSTSHSIVDGSDPPFIFKVLTGE
jgi:hypothetical protein